MKPLIRPGNEFPSPRRQKVAWGIFFTLVPLGALAVTIIVAGTLASVSIV